MNKYDAIVVGSGYSGLISALSLLNSGNKVLLLDSNNNIGGMSKSIVKGRFEFETAIHNLFIKKNYDAKYKIENILSKCGFKGEFNYASLPELCRIITPDVDYTMPFGIENFINKMESYVVGSEVSMKTFFELATECREALDYVYSNLDRLDIDYIKEQYNNFMRISTYSVSKVLDTIEMPIEAQEILNAMWIYFGSSETELSFVEYAVFLINAVEYGLQVPVDRSYFISSTISNDFLERGGEIRLNSKVTKLLVEDNKINGVKLEDGTMLYANFVVVNSSLNNVYGKLISPEDVPRKALKNVNKRELGGKLFSVHLGLNRSASELGLTNYMYLLYNSLDSDVEYSKMKQVSSGNQIAIVHNNASDSYSPLGTCMISLNTIFFEESFGDYINSDNYYEECDDIAYNLIDTFQKRTGVRIIDYIEELEIRTPIDNVVISDTPDGSLYGYKLKGLDNLLPRMLNKSREDYIEGLEVCSGFDSDIFGYNSSFIAGYDASKVGDK